MSERDDLAVRAEVLSKLADQLGEQLAVERKANEELRTMLRDGPASGAGHDEVACVAPVATTLAAVAVGMSICAAVAASWIGHGGRTMCHASRAAVVGSANASVTPLGAPAPASGPKDVPIAIVPAPSWEPAAPTTFEVPSNPRDCGRIVNATAARCFVEATGGSASGEFMLRNLVLAHTLLGERARARTLADRYFREYGDSPFARQIRQLGYTRTMPSPAP